MLVFTASKPFSREIRLYFCFSSVFFSFVVLDVKPILNNDSSQCLHMEV